MFKFLTSKKGFTIVELLMVLALLSLGVFAVGNLIRVAHQSFDKSEERYIKQEAVKEVAKLLQTGTTSVAAAKTADIFDVVDVVPAGAQDDDSYSYLFAEESINEDTGEVDGYFLYVQNKGTTRSSAMKLSETPIYVEIKPYTETKTKLDANDREVLYAEQYNAVTITLAALEDDYTYADEDGDGEIDPPTSDDIYYSLDVAYHFPNMVVSNEYAKINHKTRTEISSGPMYNQVADNAVGGKTGEIAYAIHCEEKGCSVAHCGCDNAAQSCDLCVSCRCPGKKGIVLRVYCDSIISPDNTEAAVSVPSMCFIATASYGLDSGEVGMLCEFRDKCLLTNPVGSAFVDAYYTISPPIAEFISEHEMLKSAVRVALKPLIVVAEYSLNEDIAPQGIASLAVFMLCGIGVTTVLIKADVRKRKMKNQ